METTNNILVTIANILWMIIAVVIYIAVRFTLDVWGPAKKRMEDAETRYQAVCRLRDRWIRKE